MKRIHLSAVAVLLFTSMALFAAPTSQQEKKPPTPATHGTASTSETHSTAATGVATETKTSTTSKTTVGMSQKARTTTHRRMQNTTTSTTRLEKIRSDATRANALLYDLINNRANLSHGAWVSTYNEVNMLTNRIYARVKATHNKSATTHARELRASVRQMHKDLAGSETTEAKAAAQQALMHLNEMLDALM